MITDELKTQPYLSLQVRLSQELINRIDANRASMTMRPTRSQMIRFLLENALSIMEEEKSNEPQS